jgi:subtilase family serine protease
MKRSIELMVLATAVLLFGFVTSLPAQEPALGTPITVSEGNQPPGVHYPSAKGTLVIPKSSMIQPVPAGHKFVAHTNIEMYIPAGITPESLPPYPGYGYETPESVACVYGFTGSVSGCNPNNSALAIPSGGSKTIAIVDAYDDPSAQSDLAWFSLQFGLPMSLSTLEVVWGPAPFSDTCPGYIPGDPYGQWEVEEALDVEWAHAMAPSATIYLVEACSESDTDLQQAVLVANNLVNCGKTGITGTTVNTTVCGSTQNAGEVSMSWGGYEFLSESTSNSCAYLDDSCFTAPNVVYVSGAGDDPGVEYPGTSPNVVSVGGLTHRRNPTTLNYLQRPAWVDTGGGQSAVEAQPSYQKSGTNYAQVQAVCGTVWRCTPDVSFIADPLTGVYGYNTFPLYGFEYMEWWIGGGTSLSAPAMAGIINNAATRSGTWAASSNAELTTIYNNMAVAADFTDITYGFCGFYMGFAPGTGWDFCSGVGTPHGYAGK